MKQVNGSTHQGRIELALLSMNNQAWRSGSLRGEPVVPGEGHRPDVKYVIFSKRIDRNSAFEITNEVDSPVVIFTTDPDLYQEERFKVFRTYKAIQFMDPVTKKRRQGAELTGAWIFDVEPSPPYGPLNATQKNHVDFLKYYLVGPSEKALPSSVAANGEPAKTLEERAILTAKRIASYRPDY